MPKESKDKPERNKSTKSTTSNSNPPKVPQTSEVVDKERDPKTTSVVSEATATDGGGSHESPSFTPTLLPRSNLSFQHLHQPMIYSGAQYLPGSGTGGFQAHPGIPYGDYPFSSQMTNMSTLNARMDKLEGNVNLLADSIQGLTRALSGHATPVNPTVRSTANVAYEDISDVEDGELKSHLGDNSGQGGSNGCHSLAALAFPTASKAESIDSELAEFASKSCTVDPEPEVLAAIKKEFVQPENCKFVIAPELEAKLLVNEPSSYIKAREQNLFNLQDGLVHGMYGLLNLTSSLQIIQQESEHEVFGELVDTARKVLLLCGHTSLELSKFRKLNVKSVFNPKFDKVCSNATEITSKLFGDDLIKTCKDTAEESAAMDKVLRAIKPSKNNFKPRPSFKSRGQYSFARNAYAPSRIQQDRFRLAAASEGTFKRGNSSRQPSRSYYNSGNFSQSRNSIV